MKVYNVGSCYPEFTGTERCVIDLDSAGLQMMILYRAPTQQEIKNISSPTPGRISACVKNGIIFFLAKFGSEEWIDLPYTSHLSRDLSLPDITSGSGLALTVYLADCRTGELKSIRLVGLSERFSKSVISMIKEESMTPFNIDTYNARINEIYAAYTTDQLVSFATDSCKIG